MKSTTEGYRLPDNEIKADYVRRNFDEIATDYDSFNDLFTFGLHRLWKNKVVRSTDISKIREARSLDLCSGSGDIALKLARANPTGTVLATDFSEGMLDVLRKKTESPRIKIEQMDATNLPADFSNRFDAVTIGYGIRNVNDRQKCLSECFRVLKSGGKFVILEVSTIKPAFLEWPARFYMEKIVPLFGALVRGQKHEMYDYLPASAKEFPGPEELSEELKTTGFEVIRYRRFLFGASMMLVARKPE